MSNATREPARFAVAVERGTLILGIGLLLAAKMADIVSTVILAQSERAFEANALVAPLMADYGVFPVVVGLSVLALALVIGVTEFAVGYLCDRSDRWRAALIRALGYGPLSGLWLYVAARNAALAGMVMA